jgi:hypothetical protein
MGFVEFLLPYPHSQGVGLVRVVMEEKNGVFKYHEVIAHDQTTSYY